MAAAAADNMSTELIIRILLWLPVASLLRLKSVCKRWCSLLASSDFAYRHHRFRISRRDHSLIRFFASNWMIDGFTRRLYLVSVDIGDENRSISCEPLECPVIEAPYPLSNVHLVGSCNGIYCLQQDRGLCLWNPATKQSANLYLPVLALSCYVAFGFDPETNDYRVLCLDSQKRNPTAHLFSLISDSWKSIHSPVSNWSYISSDLKTPYRDRFYCCWLSEMLLSFDFSNEVFRTISLPEDSALRNPSGLFILRENIACGNDLRDGANGFEIWMLKDFNANEYWTKLYTLSSLPYGDLICHYGSWTTGFTMNGDFLLIPRWDACIYDIVAEEEIDLSVSVEQCLPYEESLVSLKRGNTGADVDLELQDGGGIMLNNVSMMGSNSWGDSDISEDVLFLILLWLPVASLLRFMLVCKSWCARIKSSYFVSQYLRLHHRQNVNDNVGLILHSYGTYNRPYCPPLFEDPSHPSHSTSCTCLISMDKFELLDLPYKDVWQEYSLIIAASFDGIICLQLHEQHYGDCGIYLWNPATKQFKVVLEAVGSRVYCSIGFGLDVKTNDYKLVNIGCSHHRWPVYIVQVYSLNTDSWRTLNFEILSTSTIIGRCVHSHTQCGKGVCCWLVATNEIISSHTILSFDLSQEVFSTIQLPDSIKHKERHFLNLEVLRDNIACISTDGDYFSEVGNWQCEIWIMNVFGVEESWAKLYTVGPFSPSLRMVVVYSKKNEDFLLLRIDGQLYTHELVTQETRSLPVQIQGPDDYEVVLYKESLVPIR